METRRLDAPGVSARYAQRGASASIRPARAEGYARRRRAETLDPLKAPPIGLR
jgi:hypothetical protein